MKRVISEERKKKIREDGRVKEIKDILFLSF
jgi:hypothetical protein